MQQLKQLGGLRQEEQLRLLVVAVVGREQVGCANGSGGGQ